MRGHQHFPSLLKYTPGDYRLDPSFYDQVREKLESHKKMVQRSRCFKKSCPEERLMEFSFMESEGKLSSKLVHEIFDMLRKQYAPESLILDSKVEKDIIVC